MRKETRTLEKDETILEQFEKSKEQEDDVKQEQVEQVSNDVIKLKAFWDSGKKFIEDNKARATKVGDSYVSKINFYKDIFKGSFYACIK